MREPNVFQAKAGQRDDDVCLHLASCCFEKTTRRVGTKSAKITRLNSLLNQNCVKKNQSTLPDTNNTFE